MAIFTGQFLLNVLGVLTALLAVGYAYFKWKYQYWKNRGVPYIEPKIPFGSNMAMKLGIREAICKLYNNAKSNGWKYCGTYGFTSPVLHVVDLDLLKHIMTKDFQHFTDRGIYINEKIDPISAHLFNLGGNKWRNLRVKLTPTFTSGKLKAMFQTLVDCGLVMEDYIEENISSGEDVDIKEILSRFSTNIIGSCAFGLECNTFKEPNSLFREYSKKHFNRGRIDMLKIQLGSSYPTLAKFFGVRLVRKDVSDFYTKVVTDTIDYRVKNNVTRKDLLQLLIDIKVKREGSEEVDDGESSLTMKEIVAQCFVFFIAGFETSSTTMTFALYELATHPEIQEKVREEINEVLAKHNNQMTYDSVNDLKYMKQVIDETLRMYPPAPALPRKCVQDYKIPGEDLVVEKGIRVMIPVIALHYDEDYFKDPNVFDPDRFSDENRKNIPQYSYVPFGEGPRVCIGERFGIMQTKVGLACLLRKFKVILSEKTQYPMQLRKQAFLPVAEGGIWLKLKKL